MSAVDDLGHEVDIVLPARRVVSLVPSLTESLASVDRAAVVGATTWCTHPEDLSTSRVRGTKNPDCAAIASLRPDLVIANKEENREIDVTRLKSLGIPVWVTDIETVPQALQSLHRLFVDALGWPAPGWLDQAETQWLKEEPVLSGRVAVPIWRDPWMVVGRSTFAGDLIQRLGLTNVFAEHSQRYPRVDLADIDRNDVDLVLLPDEPYPFSESDGPEAFHLVSTATVSGRHLTWYGPSLVDAWASLTATLEDQLPPD